MLHLLGYIEAAGSAIVRIGQIAASGLDKTTETQEIGRELRLEYPAMGAPSGSLSLRNGFRRAPLTRPWVFANPCKLGFPKKNGGIGIMAYAIIRTGGKQYKVEPGETIRVEKLQGEVGSDIEFPEVLLRSTDDGLSIGAPLVADAKVAGKIVEQDRAKKILVFHKKRRKTFKKLNGHRQPYTAVRIDSVA